MHIFFLLTNLVITFCSNLCNVFVALVGISIIFVFENYFRSLSLLRENLRGLRENFKNKIRPIAYNSPADVLKRHFQNPTIPKSFHKFEKAFHKLNQGEKHKFFGDYFSSSSFQEMLATLSPEEMKICNGLPLIIGLYRYVYP